MYGGMGDPGHKDLIYAEFQTKMRAREALTAAPNDRATGRIRWLFGNWILVVAAGLLVAIVFDDTVVDVIVAAAVVVVMVVQAVMWIRRRRQWRQPPRTPT